MSRSTLDRLLRRGVLLAMSVSWPHAAFAQAPDATMAAKLSAYVDCINHHSNWVQQSRNRYLSWIASAERGPTGREQIVYGLYALRDPADCREGVVQAAALPPDDTALEQAAADYVSTLEAAVSVVEEANTYYELENWKDDGMRQGKALHPRLLAAFAAFDTASERLYGAVVTLKDAATERRLAALEDDPSQRAAWLAERLLFDAKRMLDRAEGIGRAGFDRAAFAAAVQRYETAWTDFSAHRKADPALDDGLYGSSAAMNAAFELLKVAKSTQRRERDGFRFDEGERALIEASAPQMVDGHPAKLLESYNSLVSWSNSAR